MNSFFSPKRLALTNYGRIGMLVFSFLSTTTVLIYIVAHLYLYRNASFQYDEISALLRMMGAEFLITVCVLFVLFLAEMIEAKQARIHFRNIAPRRFLLAGAVFLCFFSQADAQGGAGTKRDAATGMQTSAILLTITKTKLVMNGEVLGHTQIPLGEKFTILNENVSGLTQRKGEVSVGCSLKITNSRGKVILQMADLFAAKDVFKVADAKYLKCIVSTGKPMAWDEHYKVTVVFWDKWGKGRLTNNVAIEMIDVP